MEKKAILFLLGEALIIFIGIPLLYFWELVPIFRIIALWIVAGYCGYQLWEDPDFTINIMVGERRKAPGKSILIRLPVVAVALSMIIVFFQEGQFFAFPVERPVIWIGMALLYPILSALPQEFIYRTFFFHRYDSIIPEKYIPFLSAFVFAFLHMVYDNWWAVGLSFIGGLLFAFTYVRTKSLFWVTVEHTLYGWLVFLLGLGGYFYESL